MSNVVENVKINNNLFRLLWTLWMKNRVLIRGLILVCLFIPMSVCGLTTRQNDVIWTYSIKDGVATIESADVSECPVVIVPDELGSCPVGSIRYSVFGNCAAMKSIVLPKNLKSISSHTFNGCRNLSSVFLPEGIRYIGDSAFQDCKKLRVINIPDGVIEIGRRAFSGCERLEFLSLPNSLRSILENAFEGCLALKGVVIPINVTTIENGVFSNCGGLESLAVDPENAYFHSESNCIVNAKGELIAAAILSGRLNLPPCVKNIPNWCFSECTDLQYLTMADSVETIGLGAFKGCSELVSIMLSSNLKVINSRAFEDCRKLKSLIIPASVYSLGDGDLCRSCDGLEFLCVEDGNDNYLAVNNCLLDKNGKLLFAATALGNLVIPAQVTSIGSNFLRDSRCLERLKTISVESGNESFWSKSNCLLSKDGVVVMGVPTDGVVKIPSGSKSIADNAFSHRFGVKEVLFPDDLESIGYAVFYDCYDLERLLLPQSLYGIGDLAFDGCKNLKTISLPNDIKRIGRQMFYGCISLTNISIPESVCEIDGFAFGDCGKLEQLHIPSSVKTIDSSAFSGCSGLKIISVATDNPWFFVDNNCLIDQNGKLYMAATDSGTIIIPDGVKLIGSHAASFRENLTKIVIPSSVLKIESSAFKCNPALREVKISEGVQYIGESAFYRCPALASVYIPASISEIGDRAFNESPLSDVHIDPANPRYKLVDRGIYDYKNHEWIYRPYWDVQIISITTREDDHCCVDITYSVIGASETADVRLLAYVGAEECWDNLIRPDVYVLTPEGNESSIGDCVPCNTKQTVSIRLPDDLAINLSQITFKLYAKPCDFLPLAFMKVAAIEGYPQSEISTNQISYSQLNNAIHWAYATEKDSLTLTNGVLSYNEKVLAKGKRLYLTATADYLLNKLNIDRLDGHRLKVYSDLVGSDLLFGEGMIWGVRECDESTSLDMTVGVLTAEGRLSPYVKTDGLVVDGRYERLFGARLSDGQIVPYVCDLTGDGLWDLFVCCDEGCRLYENIGNIRCPQFVLHTNESILKEAVVNLDVNMNSPAHVIARNVDTWYGNMISSTLCKNGDILAGLNNGCIVQYKEEKVYNTMWGGTYPGFASGLMVAYVDWDGDSGVDCICGTSDGRLLLLRELSVGRPRNLIAKGGEDSVKLSWEVDVISTLRGYNIYRSVSGREDYVKICEQSSTLSYCDRPPDNQVYDYRVSSVSRFYAPGSHLPTEIESELSEPIAACIGEIKFFWNDVVCKLGENANVMLSIENSMNYNVAGKTQVITYDPEYLRPLKVASTGLTEGIGFTESFADGKWTISMTSGTLPAGGGKFFTLVFETLKEGMTTVGGAKVTIAARSENAPYQLGDVNGDGKLDNEDVRELARLKNGNGRKYTQNQLKAGDFNGNGKLDNADYQALRELLKEKGVL